MKKILYLTNIPSPYRVQFFDALGRECDVTVLLTDRMEEMTERDRSWFRQETANFRMVQLQRRVAKLRGEDLCLDVVNWLSKPYDRIFIGGYSSPTIMLAMVYLRSHRIPFLMEVDGGLIRKDPLPLYLYKKWLVTRASGWVSSGESVSDYLAHYGAKREKIYRYPFSSLTSADILSAPVSEEKRCALRQELGMGEEKVLLAVGQFVPRKGFDILLKSAASLPPEIGIYIVGGEPTEEYVQMREQLGLQNVHFLGFQSKESLARYYMAADAFVLPTREDIWGLVIGEAMSYGLPVVTTDRCVAGLEFVENGVNGYLVSVEDVDALAEKLKALFSGDFRAMGEKSLEKIRPYTIENMVRAHMEIINREKR